MTVRLTQISFLLVFFLALFSAGRLVQINAASLAYLWHREGSFQSFFIPKPTWNDTLFSRHPNLTIWLSQDAVASGDLVKAEQQIQQLIVLNNPNALSLQGQIFVERGEFSAALTLWRQLGDTGALLQAARTAAAAQRLDEARAAYQTAYEIDAEAAAYEWANFQWTRLEAFQGAEETLTQVIGAYPNSRQYTRWLHLLGRLFRRERRWNEALATYEHLVDLDAGDVTSLIQLGWTRYERDGFTEEVADYFQAAISADPRRGDGYLASAQVLARQERFAEADPWYKEAIRRNPDAINLHLAYAANARQQKEPELALSRYTAVAELFPESAHAFYELSWAYFQTEEKEKARTAIQKAIELSQPNVPNGYLQRREAIESGS